MTPGIHQRYRYGWFFACSTLAGVYPDFHTLGTGPGVFLAVWSLMAGLAAAFVKPWGWLTLLLTHLLWLGWAPIVLLLTTSGVPRIIFMGIGLLYILLSAAYFYKRHAMFGAQWRWRRAERWWLQLVGPDTYTGPAAGFLSLSWSRRLLVVAVVGVFMLLKSM